MSIEIAKTTVKKVKAPKEPKIVKEKVIKEKVIKDINPHTRSDTEAINLAKIHNHLNTNTPCGMKIRQAFTEAFPDTSQFATSVISGGNRSIHHDFQVKWTDGPDILKNVEFKGSKYKKVVDATKPPWVDGVQFYNGTGRNFGVGKEYARQFYDTMLDEIIAHYNITVPKPSYEEWEKDAFCQGKPKTPFVIELRSKGYRSDYLSECRKKFNKQFVLNETQLETLKNEVFAISNQVLSSKDYWLQIHGAMDEPDDFEVKWTGKQGMTPIVNVERSVSNSDCDVNFKFTCEDGSVFSAKLRWGYGQCITNIRLDIK